MAVETVAVGLLSGAAGALLSTLLRIRHERDEQLRDRLIVAADDFSTGAVQAMLALRDASGALGMNRETAGHRIVRAVELVDETHARLARVELLFGDESPAGQAGLGIVLALRSAAFACNINDFNPTAYEEGFEAAQKEHAAFNRAALAAIRGTPWWRHRIWRESGAAVAAILGGPRAARRSRSNDRR